MEFSKALEQFVERLKNIRNSIATEEATKTALIMPFFALLGYDVFNPLEFVPEYIADVGTKKGEKVDYAILKNGNPVVLIEAKSVNQKLAKHSGQLHRYFAGTKAKFAILTNGIQYRFYTDLDEPNKMDERPFNQIDLLNLKSSHIDDLSRFHKSSFDVASLLDSASLLKWKGDFKQLFAEQMENPSDEFVKLFLHEIYQGVKTQSVVARFKPVLKQAMGELIYERMNDKIQTALNATSEELLPVPIAEHTEAYTDPAPVPAPELTDFESKGFEKFRTLMSDYIDPQHLSFEKGTAYTSFTYHNNAQQWICRLRSSADNITLTLPHIAEQEIHCRIANLYEMNNYKPYMLSILNGYADLSLPYDPKTTKVYTVDLVRYTPRRVHNPR